MRNSTLLKTAIAKGFKVGHCDIETSPHELWGYGLFNQNFSTGQIKEPGKITSIAYLTEGNKTTTAIGWVYDKESGGCDYNLLQRYSEWHNEQDLIIGQNWDSFDLKWIQWRLNLNNLPAVKDTLTLDTLKMSRKVFRPPSHKLDYRSTAYGFGGKIDQTMKQIIAVAQGDPKETAERIRYNIKDVLDERRIFWKELDAYRLPKKLEKFLLDFIRDEQPFCSHCAEIKQRKFDVEKFRVKMKNSNRYKFKYQCLRCETIWDAKK